MSFRTDAEYRAMGIPNASQFDWRVEPERLTNKQIYARKRWREKLSKEGKSQAAIQKALLTRENPHVDLSAYGITNSERAGR